MEKILLSNKMQTDCLKFQTRFIRDYIRDRFFRFLHFIAFIKYQQQLIDSVSTLTLF